MQEKQQQASSSSSSAAAAAAAAQATQQGENDRAFQQQLFQFLEQHASAASSAAKGKGPHLRVGPSTIPGAGRGLFLLRSNTPTKKGDILTLYPGLTYLLPLDLEPLTHVDEALAGPPDFLLGNAYILRVGLPSTVQRYGFACDWGGGARSLQS